MCCWWERVVSPAFENVLFVCQYCSLLCWVCVLFCSIMKEHNVYIDTGNIVYYYVCKLIFSIVILMYWNLYVAFIDLTKVLTKSSKVCCWYTWQSRLYTEIREHILKVFHTNLTAHISADCHLIDSDFVHIDSGANCYWVHWLLFSYSFSIVLTLVTISCILCPVAFDNFH